jgi:hypothetical protein
LSFLIPPFLFLSLLFIKSYTTLCFYLFFVETFDLFLVLGLLFRSLRVIDMTGPFIVICEACLEHSFQVVIKPSLNDIRMVSLLLTSHS